jgi:hypothetical protein
VPFTRRDDIRTTKRVVYYWHEIKHCHAPKPRAYRGGGILNFDWRCKAMCNPEICEKQYQKFIENGGVTNDEE